ncbi:MAG: hypothetical protein DRR06_13440 [Gammaproteobacteria bacterium]|nr:MAG: hypothetical protein DRR06_13440 [Gammaproteobacteria bacterium]
MEQQLNKKKMKYAGLTLFAVLWLSCFLVALSMSMGCRTVEEHVPIVMPDVIEKPVHEPQKEIVIPIRSDKPTWSYTDSIDTILIKMSGYILRLEEWADSITRRVEASNDSIE